MLLQPRGHGLVPLTSSTSSQTRTSRRKTGVMLHRPLLASAPRTARVTCQGAPFVRLIIRNYAQTLHPPQTLVKVKRLLHDPSRV